MKLAVKSNFSFIDKVLRRMNNPEVQLQRILDTGIAAIDENIQKQGVPLGKKYRPPRFRPGALALLDNGQLRASVGAESFIKMGNKPAVVFVAKKVSTWKGRKYNIARLLHEGGRQKVTPKQQKFLAWKFKFYVRVGSTLRNHARPYMEFLPKTLRLMTTRFRQALLLP